MAQLPRRIQTAPSALQAGTWPQLTPETAAAFMQVFRGIAPNPTKYLVVESNYYHRVAYAAAGQTSLTFFNVSYNDGVCNLQGNTVPTERPFWLKKIRITQQDITAAGAVQASNAAEAFQFGATASITIPLNVPRLEAMRTALMAGRVSLRVGDLEVVNAYSLYRFPSGGGPNADMSLSTATTATSLAGISLNNGIPAVFNQYVLEYPIPVLPGVPITFNLNWASALAVTGGFTLMAELAGPSIIPLTSR